MIKRVYNVIVKYILLLSIFLFLLPQRAFADSLVPLVNEQRATPLIENKLLDQSAHNKACDMIKNHYWAHTVIPRLSWSVEIDQVHYKYKRAGENIAQFNGDTSDEGVIQAWMHSPKHKEVLQRSYFKEVGIGRCGNIVVAHFGTR